MGAAHPSSYSARCAWNQSRSLCSARERKKSPRASGKPRKAAGAADRALVMRATVIVSPSCAHPPSAIVIATSPLPRTTMASPSAQARTPLARPSQ